MWFSPCAAHLVARKLAGCSACLAVAVKHAKQVLLLVAVERGVHAERVLRERMPTCRVNASWCYYALLCAAAQQAGRCRCARRAATLTWLAFASASG